MTAEPKPDAPGEQAADDADFSDVASTLWDALQGGEATSVEDWLSKHPQVQDYLPDLRLIHRLHDALKVVREDATYALAETRAYPPGYQPPTMTDFLSSGALLGQYRIERALGHGGMGEVYLAEHTLMMNKVAVKVLPAKGAADAGSRERFLQEMRTLARLRPHPHVAAAFDAGIHEGRLYLVMEYVPGTDLAKHVRQSGPMPVEEACRLIRQCALGLEYMHGHDIVHRDLKPSNLMLTPEQTVKILDLGLARYAAPSQASGDDALTGSGALLGTLDYLAPEQAHDAHAADARSDLYSLGCTFYHLLAGRPPFGHVEGLNKIAALARDVPLSVRELRPEVPEAVAAVVHQLLEKKPDDRYPSARAFLEALDAAERGAGPAEALRPRAREGKLRRRRTMVAALVVIAAGVAILAMDRLVFHQPAATPTPANLKELTFYFRRGPGLKPVYSQLLVSAGQEQPAEPIEPSLTPEDDFKIVGVFDQPTYWYLVWIDTQGKAKVEGRSDTPQTRLEYPAREDRFEHVNPADPPGMHLLLLAAGTAPPDVAVPELEQRLGDIGRPPAQLPHLWSVQVRGAGGERVVPEELLPTKYFEALKSRMPPGLEVVQMVFVQFKR